MINLREIAEERGYRITVDESSGIDDVKKSSPWYYQIPCARGHIWVWGEKLLAAYCNRPRLFAQLWAIPGVQRYQTGDREVNVKFPPEALDQVLELLQPRRKTRYSPEERSRRAERVAQYRFLPRQRTGLSGKDAPTEGESSRLSG